jgi:hypothetical protein
VRVAIPPPDECSPHWRDYAHALRSGIIACGDQLVSWHAHCDASVTWGWRYKARALATRGPVLVLERGYVERMQWISAGWNGLNGLAKRPIAQDTGQRWDDHFQPMVYRPWRVNPTGYALLLGQVKGDAALDDLHYPSWLYDTAQQLINAGHKVVFRKHPKNATDYWLPAGVSVAPTALLTWDLRDAKFAVTFNSNSAVDAVLEGTPCVTEGRGSMAWDVTSHDMTIPVMLPNRSAWAAWLAWQQWLPAELESGAMWRVLRACIPEGEPT